ncbi:ribonuclease Z [Polyangium aurulentum]|uniref:ribonuclease Z n=1 Tax=Polyangium aurulentum TaxID=2567896 RepID=UPI0010AE456A|nr:ribonuclease Z [Polyangium aurulentum]UQA60694.1 ribonuclease Z [Polyangium aurulentum]
MSSMRLTFLGTSAAAPTAYRNLSGLFLKREGQSFLFDCGEGTQRQMIRYGTGFALDAVFFTHFHADHYLGIIGFVRTLGMLGRTDPLVLYGPRPAATFLPKVLRLGAEDASLPVEVIEVNHGTVIRGDGYRIEAFATDHRVPSVGYALIEDERPGRFDLSAARTLGIPDGPLFGRLQRGEAITLPDGRDITPDLVIGPPRPGRRVVVSGDTRPCEATTLISQGADLVIHEATFGDFEQGRAVDTRHSTAREAARVAKEAGARRLVLTHLSTRYDREPGTLLEQAKEVFDACEVADDGLVIDLPQHD